MDGAVDKVAEEMAQLTPALLELAEANRELAHAVPSRRTTKALIAIAVVAVVAAVASLITVTEIRHTQIANRRISLTQANTLATDTHILQLVIGAVGPAATKTSQAETKLLLTCLDNRIDVDTGHAKPLAECAP